MNADPGWPALPENSLAPTEQWHAGDFVSFTDGTSRQILKTEQSIVNNRPGESGKDHISIVTTILFEPNEQRWVK